MTEEKETQNKTIENAVRCGTDFMPNDFMRQLYIDLTADEDTPVDILENNFGLCEQKDVTTLAVRGEVDLTFTCEIGFDEKEEYWDKETYNDHGVTRVRDVKKTRTVTKWQPFSGTNKSTEVSLVKNRSDADVSECRTTDKFAINAIANRAKENDEPLNAADYQPNPTAVEIAKQIMLEKSFNRVKLPGDHQKNQSYSGNVSTDAQEICVLPQYCVKYRYQEKEYTAKTFACGKPNCIFDAPSDTMNVYDMTDKKVKKITLPILISALCLLAVAVILAICNVFAEIPIFLYYIFGFIGIFMILTWIIIRSPLKTKYRKQVINDRQLVKQQALIKLLEEKGMKALTQDELKMTVGNY